METSKPDQPTIPKVQSAAIPAGKIEKKVAFKLPIWVLKTNRIRMRAVGGIKSKINKI